jgi:ABC-2 type transport system ATP-binding protein
LKENRTEIVKQMNFAAVYAQMPGNLSVYQNLYVFGLLYQVRNLKEKIESLLRDFDLGTFTDIKAGLLSSGELTRLNLAKALINEPSLLLLDEPTASLDPSVAEFIREKIKKRVEEAETTVLWTSHNMHEIEAVCDRVLFLSHGKILLTGNPRTLPAEYGKKDLEELFISVAREPLFFEE